VAGAAQPAAKSGNALLECLDLAHRVISLLRSNLVASGVKRTSITEPDL
jgi:hypothetical protein